ncbi:AB-hydrolase YheT [Ascobolus immersus RN42]|uniref:alcohol O-acetyltransferase n=1 Tax=Ascobolus immersus RN42 TaxID=1160509 RepID=A0A3N4IIB9_ASCIM|nr:AB-hydrolase YheT [Ascobolus immersus RN42]
MSPLSSLGWNSELTTYHSDNTVALQPREAGTPTTLDALSSSILTPFKAHPLLFNGHLQTAWTVATQTDIPVYYGRKIMKGRDGGSFAVDFVVSPFEGTDYPAESTEGLPPRTRFLSPEEIAAQETPQEEDTKPMIIALHGLSGGSHELYLRAVLDPLVKQGWEAAVVNARGCANSKITTHQLFNARFTDDVREFVVQMRRWWPKRDLYAIGFSLGANILCNYLGDEGPSCQFKAAVLCSSPWNLEASSLNLERTFLGKEVYSRVMGSSLKRLFEDHVDVLMNDPLINVEKIRATKYLWEFDRDLTAKVFGYPTVGAYYRDASSIDNLVKVAIPTFIVHAEDDPVAPKEAIPYDEVRANPYAFMAVTSMGGHLSWFEPNGERWYCRIVTDWLGKMQREVGGVERREMRWKAGSKL